MLPTDAKERKGIPVYEGFFKYFPDAIAAVAQCSAISNAQHSGENAPVQWVKGTSTDEKDALLRHMLDGTFEDRDKEGVMHAVKVGWRAFANLQRMADAGINIFAVLNTLDEPLNLVPTCVPGMVKPNFPEAAPEEVPSWFSKPEATIEIQDRRRMYEPALQEEWKEPDVEA